MGVNYRTVQRWAAWYRDGGRAEFGRHKMGGKGTPPFLTEEQQGEVAAEVATGRFRTAAEIGEWIAETYGVTYTESGIYSLMGRLKCAPKVPRPLHLKTDLAAQEAWKKGASSKRSSKQGSRQRHG